MSAAAVSCEPISWLRLERYHAGELPIAERATIAGHLGACDRCQACLDRIQSFTTIDLPPLPVGASSTAATAATAAIRPRRPTRAATWSLLGLGSALAAAAVLVVVARRAGGPIASSADGHLVRAMGGDAAFELVREHNGSVAYDPGSFAPSDRFKVLLTCPPPQRLYVDVAVEQADGVAFPVEPVAVACGNRVALTPAFRITGPGPATVCVTVDQAHPPPRARPPSASPAHAPADGQPGCVHLDRADD